MLEGLVQSYLAAISRAWRPHDLRERGIVTRQPSKPR